MADKLVTKPGDNSPAVNGTPTAQVKAPGEHAAPADEMTSWDDFNLDTFAKNCADNKYVLVIGNEAVLKMNENDAAYGNSSKFIYHLTTDYLNSDDIMNVNPDHYKNFTELARKTKTDVWSHVHEMIKRHRTDNTFDKSKIEPSLKKLLETRCFRIVITTTIDPFVEMAMEEVWGKGKFDVKSLWDSSNDISKDSLTTGEFDEIRPILYYAFGSFKRKAGDEYQKFVLTENDAMEAVSKWFSASGPERLVKFIRENKKVLSIGCRFDDWLFRFFWYILIGDVKKLRTGQVVVELDEQRDSNLRRFLENEKIIHFSDAREFMVRVTAAINNATDLGNLPRKDGIFISYAHEDKYIALHMFWRLHEEGWNVWIDEDKLKGGNDYNKRIRDAINACNVFIPILSSQVQEDLVNNNHRYYMDEWQLAQDRWQIAAENDKNRIKILPIVVGRDYNERTDYHKALPECMQVTIYDARKGMDSITLSKRIKEL